MLDVCLLAMGRRGSNVVLDRRILNRNPGVLPLRERRRSCRLGQLLNYHDIILVVLGSMIMGRMVREKGMHHQVEENGIHSEH